MSDNKKTEQFGTEVSELLQLIIHSLYSHPEIFLRELVSNASDALDKLKLEALTDAKLAPQGYEPFIRIEADKENRTLSIIDNGIGMTAEEVKENIGTIAHSGTKAFLAKKEELKDRPDLIGQFGVGFYSAFIVADKVELLTQKAGSDTAILWESDGKGTYSIEETKREAGLGTTIKLFLKPAGKEEGDLEDFTDEWVLKNIIKKHSDFISYPIKMETSKEKPVGEAKEGEEQKYETVIEDEVLNSQKALWIRQPSDIKEEEYKEFYKNICKDFKDPVKTIHYKAEGTTEFSALMFIPESKPWNYDYEDADKGLSLYVKRVLIMNNCEELLPTHLRFVKGLVDSSDLSLNVSREILQKDRQIVAIKKAVTSRVYKTLDDMLKKDRETYEKFWHEFGASLKEGIVRDPSQKDKILPLSLFQTTNSSKISSLKEYIERMPETQKDIFYIFGESRTYLEQSPHIEKLRDKGFEVILLTDRIDEFMIQHLDKFEEKKFVSITDAELDVDTEEEKKQIEEDVKKAKAKLEPVLEVIRTSLQDDISEVRISKRLKDSPVCLVADGQVPSAQLEQLYKQMGQELPKVKRIMEVNPEHPLFERMLDMDKDKQKEFSEILYAQALLSEGSSIPDPAGFSKKVANLMMSAV